MNFSVMFFSSLDTGTSQEKYRVLLETARFADARRFDAIWLPERHFHEFGGLFPNPAVVAAAVAMATSQIQLRAGSVISPLHDPIRIVEEWSIVDNLSNGRVAMSFGSGWNADDFVFFPDRYQKRRELMYEQIGTIRHLWAGGGVLRKNALGKKVEVKVFPRPLQTRPELWITSGGSSDTFAGAGGLGANLLTSFEKLTPTAMASRIDLYRSSLRVNGFNPAEGKVAVMLHTFLGENAERVKSLAHTSMRRYLQSAIDLDMKAAAAGTTTSASGSNFDRVDGEDREFLAEIAFEKYFNGPSLLGTVDQRIPLVRQLAAIGIDEIACLVDFLDSPDLILDGLVHLDRLRDACSSGLSSAPASDGDFKQRTIA